MIYNLADTFFIGRTNDPYKVAAASLAFVLFNILNALANLFGIGGGSLISRLLGQKRGDDARYVCALSFYCLLYTSTASSRSGSRRCSPTASADSSWKPAAMM